MIKAVVHKSTADGEIYCLKPDLKCHQRSYKWTQTTCLTCLSFKGDHQKLKQFREASIIRRSGRRRAGVYDEIHSQYANIVFEELGIQSASSWFMQELQKL